MKFNVSNTCLCRRLLAKMQSGGRMLSAVRMSLAAVAMILAFAPDANAAESEGGRVVAYVTSWSQDVPNPFQMTDINYAFGHVAETFDGVGIANPDRLRMISSLKEKNPDLNVLLSIGGWGSGRFSEMAADSKLRANFAKDCRRVMDEYNLDGIDIDWEYPTSNAAGISSSPDDTKNFTLLMRDIRKELPDGALLTLASVWDGNYIDFPAIMPYVDFVNIMSYDMGNPPYHHSPLYATAKLGQNSSDAAVKSHIAKGVPAEKLTMGIPFYGRGKQPYGNFADYKDIALKSGCVQQWDTEACAPYITDAQGNMVLGYDNPQSIAIKCKYIKDNNLLGAMYWDYSGADDALRQDVADQIMHTGYPANYARAPRFKALLYYSDTAESAHVDFANQAIEFFHRLTYGEGYILDKTTSLADYVDRLGEYSVIIVINATPAPGKEREAMEQYMENGGGWLGFHAAAYNDRNTHWPWLNKFLGCGAFYCNNWPPQCVLVDIDTNDSPVTRNIPTTFVAPESEWYQWSPSPRENPDVEILASISPKNYPLGIKDVISSGDFPIAWRNRNYRMVYLNYGHGDREFTDATQNLLTLQAFRYVVSTDPKGNPFEK